MNEKAGLGQNAVVDDSVVEAEYTIVDPVDPMVGENGIVYTAVVKSCHDGYSFLGEVKRGYETIATNGDVFAPVEMKVGEIVKFDELHTDPRRPGKFRTENATLIKNALVLAEDSNNSVAPYDLMRRSAYHKSAKAIDLEQVEKALENQPFADVVLRKIQGGEQDNLVEQAVNFLRENFAMLAQLDISCSITDQIDLNAEKQTIREGQAVYREQGLDGMVASLASEYESFYGVRECFKVMHQNNILSAESIIPIYYLPDLLVTAPVWFIDSKDILQDNEDADDPKPDHAIKFFCNQVNTKEFAWLYQIYNRRTRPLSAFSGRDIMPLKIVKVLEKAKKVFDYVVVATPYHDIASREWTDPEWLRNIDPFLIGFKKELPFMFLLGRWSGTGLFPLMCDMIADTIGHLRINKAKLRNFESNSYWHMGMSVHSDVGVLQPGGSENNTVLEVFADALIAAFEKGKLFEFLRGETLVPAKQQ